MVVTFGTALDVCVVVFICCGILSCSETGLQRRKFLDGEVGTSILKNEMSAHLELVNVRAWMKAGPVENTHARLFQHALRKVDSFNKFSVAEE
ncbi:uncharacterized protein MYCGRDRAFT_106454 [Zymoseptoria tritici IPO323]|uniref:Uncharacterized protein n=1 Tax=Zymoseptoria tritici (strain CBS 115943 / IPO323) TaxID=336722 RepID=F9XPQ9_ZYMTI|nr:uncharacterized protein MYCGRDRAFT_106454 [Zymoseptoria tritici IPO323]EGP82503.1 hypothetical protein MYCGRDRAFT_106454 [Zymoseptoria tritici IPO323]